MNLHETVMGQRLIQGTLPDIAEQLKRIADSLEKLTESKDVVSFGKAGVVTFEDGWLENRLNEYGNTYDTLPNFKHTPPPPKKIGEGTAQMVLDYVESNGSVTHKEMQEYYKSLNGSNTFAYCLKNLIIPYKNRKTKRYLIKNDIGKYEVRLANPSNWVVKDY
jgi:hypothetical protein